MSQHQTEVEPDTFAFGNTVVSAFQVGRYFNGGSSDIGFATSTNGGDTFTHGFLPGLTKHFDPARGPYDRASDPSVAFDAKHNVWLISSLGLITPDPNDENSFLVDVVVNRSTDGGRTWGPAIVVNQQPGKRFLDKNWTACDNTPTSPFFGNCYTEFDEVGRNDLEMMSTSHDGGLTWGPDRVTADKPNDFSIPAGTPGAHGLGGQPVVLPNGRVVVPYVNLDVELVGIEFAIGSFISTDGGNSWSATHFITDLVRFHPPNGGIRADIPLPTAEVDAAGRVYVVWADCRFQRTQPLCPADDLVISNSTNGVNWSAVQRIPTSPVGSAEEHMIPGLGVDRTTRGVGAHLGLTYYFYPNTNCTQATCQLMVGFISSTNGGATWTNARTVAGPMKLTWLANTSQGRMVGDYISTSILPGSTTAVPIFAVATAPSSTGIFNEAMFTATDLTLSAAGSVPADSPQVASPAGTAVRSLAVSADAGGFPLLSQRRLF